MSTRQLQEKIVANLNQWKQIENASVSSTGKVIEKTENPIIRLVMEIIQRDSQMHYRVQEFLVDTMETKAVTLTPEELEAVWDLIESHIELERATTRIAKESLEALRGTKMVVQEYLLDYLMIDEKKHNAILASLETIKNGMYPYG